VAQTHARLRLQFVIVVTGTLLPALLIARPHTSGPVMSWTGDDVAITTAWAVAVLSCAWLLVVSVLCEVGLRTRASGVARLAARLAPGFARRLAEAAIVASFVAGPVVPAGASDRSTAPAQATAPDEPVVRSPTPGVEEHGAPPAPSPVPPAPTPVPLGPARRQTYTVRTGDNLWRIARAELVRRGNVRPDDTTVARYWQAVITANRTVLRSGNPNLIFPGELVALPEPG